MPAEKLDLRDQPPLAEADRPPVPSRFSQTFLRHVAKCPHSGALYLKFGGGPGSQELDRGTAIHMVGERMGRHALEYGEVTVPHDVVRELVHEVLADPDLTIPPDEIDGIHVQAFHMSEALAFRPDTIAALETKVVLQIGEWLIVGKIDFAWVDGERAGVWDYKTTLNLPDNSAWGMPTTDDGKKRIRRFLFQTLLYALLLKYGRPVYRCDTCGGSGEVGDNPSPINDPQMAVTGTCPGCHGEGEIVSETPLAPRATSFEIAEKYPAYLNVDEETGEKKLAERSTVISLEELENHRRWLEGLIEKTAGRFVSGKWPAIPGAHCNECPAETLCPLPPWARDRAIDPETGEVMVVDSNESARAALALRDRLNADAAKLWDQAKDWADQGNVIVVGDQVYEFKPTSSRSVRKSKGNGDWDGLVDAIKLAAETGEDFDVDYWIKKSESTRFQKRSLKPHEKTPDYPEEIEDHGQPAEPAAGPALTRPGGERFGDVPF